jgi:chemotaxis protein histidine kinase CheA
MTDVTNIKVKNRLGELMKQPGGRSVIDALRGAEQRVDRHKDQFLAALDRSIDRMEAAGAKLDETPNAAAAVEIYQAANDMIAMAGLVGFETLDEVAHGLCDLIDVLRAEGAWSDQAIKVHIDAVLMLRASAPQDTLARERVLEGLRKVWARFGVEARG